MLEALRIRDLGVIEDVEVELGTGLCVVTGETGAGKTMVVTGLQLLFGGRADASRVRVGADQASVEGRVRVVPGSAAAMRALDAGGEMDDGELLLRRTVTSAGRSRAQIGGTAAPVGVLGAVGEDLFTVHGQADQIRLATPTAQRSALDRFAAIDRQPYAAAFARWQAAELELTERTRDRSALMRESDLLTFGLGEIETVSPLPGEDAELQALAARLASADELRLAARVAHDALVGDAEDPTSDALDTRTLLAMAHRQLASVADVDAHIAELALRLGELSVLAEDLGADLGIYLDGLEADPGRLAATEGRRAELTRLTRRYLPARSPNAQHLAGPTIDDVLEWAAQARSRLTEIDTSDEALGRLASARDAAAEQARIEAGLLTSARTVAADALGRAVTVELHGLAMADARLDVEIRPRPVVAGSPVLVTADGTPAAAGAQGVDEVELLLRPNSDSPARPLARGASGGELSRIMLALEVVLAGTDPVPVMVFDEVDAGVGGRAAVEVGRRLARLARQHQVIVVTHLAQVAAFGDVHLVVTGGVDAGGVDAGGVDAGGGDERGGDAGDAVDGGAARAARSAVVRVDGAARVAELARMLAGRDTSAARAHAAELLADAQADRLEGQAVVKTGVKIDSTQPTPTDPVRIGNGPKARSPQRT